MSTPRKDAQANDRMPGGEPEQLHWLYRRETIPKLWLAGYALLALTLALEVFIDLHSHFGFSDWFSFNAIYGFFTCLAMVVFAKWLSRFVKRPDDYYDAEVNGDPKDRHDGENQ